MVNAILCCFSLPKLLADWHEILKKQQRDTLPEIDESLHLGYLHPSTSKEIDVLAFIYRITGIQVSSTHTERGPPLRRQRGSFLNILLRL